MINMEECKSVNAAGVCGKNLCEHGCYNNEVPDFNEACYDWNLLSETCWKTIYNVNPWVDRPSDGTDDNDNDDLDSLLGNWA